MLELAETLIKGKQEKEVYYSDSVVFRYDDDVWLGDLNSNKEIVKISIIEKKFLGNLGGQYWGLIYSPKDDYLDEKNIKIYDEYKSTGSGDNIFIYEKVKENWYFFYEDFDGHVDTSKISAE